MFAMPAQAPQRNPLVGTPPQLVRSPLQWKKRMMGDRVSQFAVMKSATSPELSSQNTSREGAASNTTYAHRVRVVALVISTASIANSKLGGVLDLGERFLEQTLGNSPPLQRFG
jgi:hypothetical protein